VWGGEYVHTNLGKIIRNINFFVIRFTFGAKIDIDTAKVKIH
jgi:hypothetical protein